MVSLPLLNYLFYLTLVLVWSLSLLWLVEIVLSFHSRVCLDYGSQTFGYFRIIDCWLRCVERKRASRNCVVVRYSGMESFRCVYLLFNLVLWYNSLKIKDKYYYSFKNSVWSDCECIMIKGENNSYILWQLFSINRTDTWISPWTTRWYCIECCTLGHNVVIINHYISYAISYHGFMAPKCRCCIIELGY